MRSPLSDVLRCDEPVGVVVHRVDVNTTQSANYHGLDIADPNELAHQGSADPESLSGFLDRQQYARRHHAGCRYPGCRPVGHERGEPSEDVGDLGGTFVGVMMPPRLLR